VPRKKEKSHRKKIVIFICLFLFVVIIGLVSIRFKAFNVVLPAVTMVKDTSGRLEQFLFVPMSRVKILWESYVDLRGAKEENEILKAQLAQLQNEITTYREALIENRRLRQLLVVKRHQPGKTLLAHIVGCDIAPWRAVVTIDRGKVDGLLPDMPVLSQGGVIGRIVETGMSYSRVMLITDYQSRIAAIVQRNRARGLLTGLGREGCRLEYVEKGIDVEAGDVIITSGMDAIFQKGLLLGEVISVKTSDQSNLFQEIMLKPFADVDKAEEVLVLLANNLKDVKIRDTVE
jgi:rod shape-determining protein MreC